MTHNLFSDMMSGKIGFSGFAVHKSRTDQGIVRVKHVHNSRQLPGLFLELPRCRLVERPLAVNLPEITLLTWAHLVPKICLVKRVDICVLTASAWALQVPTLA